MLPDSKLFPAHLVPWERTLVSLAPREYLAFLIFEQNSGETNVKRFDNEKLTGVIGLWIMSCKTHHYTFKLISCFLLVDIHQLILNVRKPRHHFRRIS